MSSGTPGEPRFDVHSDLTRNSINHSHHKNCKMRTENLTELNNAYCFSGELRNGSLEICKGVIKFKGDLTFRLKTLHAINTS